MMQPGHHAPGFFASTLRRIIADVHGVPDFLDRPPIQPSTLPPPQTPPGALGSWRNMCRPAAQDDKGSQGPQAEKESLSLFLTQTAKDYYFP